MMGVLNSPGKNAMIQVNLMQLIADLPFGGGLATDAKRGDVAAMAQLMAEGVCPTGAINVLHYYPERLIEVLEATRGLPPELRQRNQAILAAMSKRFNGRQKLIYNAWQNLDAARRGGAPTRPPLKQLDLAAIER